MSGRERPAVEGLPAVRPRCVWCDRPLPIMSNDVRPSGSPYHGPIVRRTFVRFTGYCWNRQTETPLFDRLRCAKDFAAAAYLGGYRRAPPG